MRTPKDFWNNPKSNVFISFPNHIHISTRERKRKRERAQCHFFFRVRIIYGFYSSTCSTARTNTHIHNISMRSISSCNLTPASVFLSPLSLSLTCQEWGGRGRGRGWVLPSNSFFWVDVYMYIIILAQKIGEYERHCQHLEWERESFGWRREGKGREREFGQVFAVCRCRAKISISNYYPKFLSIFYFSVFFLPCA